MVRTVLYSEIIPHKLLENTFINKGKGFRKTCTCRNLISEINDVFAIENKFWSETTLQLASAGTSPFCLAILAEIDLSQEKIFASGMTSKAGK